METQNIIDMASARIADWTSDLRSAGEKASTVTEALLVAERCQELCLLLWQTEDSARKQADAIVARQ